MDPDSLRFSPPRVSLPREMRWVLLRAFGPDEVEAEDVDGPEALLTARAFALAGRIAARRSFRGLAREVGRTPAIGFLTAFAANALRSRDLAALVPEVASVAADAGIPIAFLKFGALRLGEIGLFGARCAGDLDVLVGEQAAAELQECLLARGFKQPDLPGQRHQLPVLLDPLGRPLEIHRHLPGVRAEGAPGFATFGDLRERGVLMKVASLPGDCSIPARTLLTAHALVHGLAQHGLAPEAYNPMRMIGDLVDLGLGVGDGRLASDVQGWLAKDVSRREVEAVTTLCRRLTQGDSALVDSEGDGDAAVLLRHIVAGVLDSDYRRWMKFKRLIGALSDRPFWTTLGRSAWSALVLSDGQIDAIYGPPSHGVGYMTRRLMRPFDLLLRGARSITSGARLFLKGMGRTLA